MSNPQKPRLRLEIADLPAPMLAAIGDVTVTWSHVLALVDVAIWGMLGLTPAMGTALTNPFKYAGKMDMFQSVGCHFFKDDKKLLADFKELLRRIRAVYGELNDIEHSLWQHYFKDGPTLRVRIGGDLSIKPKFVPVSEVEAVSQTMIQLFIDLNEFMKKHVPEPRKASQKKSP